MGALGCAGLDAAGFSGCAGLFSAGGLSGWFPSPGFAGAGALVGAGFGSGFAGADGFVPPSAGLFGFGCTLGAGLAGLGSLGFGCGAGLFGESVRFGAGAGVAPGRPGCRLSLPVGSREGRNSCAPSGRCGRCRCARSRSCSVSSVGFFFQSSCEDFTASIHCAITSRAALTFPNAFACAFTSVAACAVFNARRPCLIAFCRSESVVLSRTSLALVFFARSCAFAMSCFNFAALDVRGTVDAVR